MHLLIRTAILERYTRNIRGREFRRGLMAKDNQITKSLFIGAFTFIMQNVLRKELPRKASEADFIAKAYDVIYKKVRHIKTNM